MMNQNLAVNYCTQKSTMDSGINQNVPESSFGKRIVKIACKAIPHIVSCIEISVGAVVGYTVACSYSNEAYFEQGYGSFRCFNKNIHAMQESSEKMLKICMVTSIITSVLSPLLYIEYNAKENTDSTKIDLKNEPHTKKR